MANDEFSNAGVTADDAFRTPLVSLLRSVIATGIRLATRFTAPPPPCESVSTALGHNSCARDPSLCANS
ncbi:hypothetical protein EVAR_74944_1 [Eumeta japonica]|uniref:Uncharacterized protein n=1 Tax=Eumeta variegata TaxID=151549 RepID=A0A4C1UJM7_EUMVA|nr:hypothetical protein EVAR_74944_1 [Eumeta japonica]